VDHGGGHEKRLGKLRLDNLGGAPFGGAALNSSAWREEIRALRRIRREQPEERHVFQTERDLQ
jgi:hypothetical protein